MTVALDQIAAPRPYAIDCARRQTDNGIVHVYLFDGNGRKIAAIWGKDEERWHTANFIVEAVNSYGGDAPGPSTFAANQRANASEGESPSLRGEPPLRILAAAIRMSGVIFSVPRPKRHHDIINTLAELGMPVPVMRWILRRIEFIAKRTAQPSLQAAE